MSERYNKKNHMKGTHRGGEVLNAPKSKIKEEGSKKKRDSAESRE